MSHAYRLAVDRLIHTWKPGYEFAQAYQSTFWISSRQRPRSSYLRAPRPLGPSRWADGRDLRHHPEPPPSPADGTSVGVGTVGPRDLGVRDDDGVPCCVERRSLPGRRRCRVRRTSSLGLSGCCCGRAALIPPWGWRLVREASWHGCGGDRGDGPRLALFAGPAW